MRRAILPLVLAGLALCATGCVSPQHRYMRKTQRTIQHTDAMVRRYGARYADKAVASYTRILRTLPRAPGLLPLERTVLLKRGEAYLLKGDKDRAEADFQAAARIAHEYGRRPKPAARPEKSPAPGAPAAQPAEGTAAEKGKPGRLPRPAAPRERRSLFTSALELSGNVISHWQVLRDSPAGGGTTLSPDEDLGVGSLLLCAALRTQLHILPRLSAGLDFAFGSVSGEEVVDGFHRYDGRVLPAGQEVRTEAGFFETSGYVRWAPKLPLPGQASLMLGAKYLSLSLDFDLPGGAGFSDTIDAFFPLLGVRYERSLGGPLRVVLDGRLCGLFLDDDDDFQVSTFYLELFGGLELSIAPHLYLSGGLRYAYATYHLYSDGEDKRLDLSSVGPFLALRLKV